MRTKSYESKYSSHILVAMTFAVAWGFIGTFWSIIMFFAQDQPFGIIILTGGTGLFGLCVPAITDAIDERLDLAPRFLK